MKLVPKAPKKSRRRQPEVNRVVAVDRLAKAPKVSTSIGRRQKSRANMGSHSKFRYGV